jgi:peptide-methionine (S)-S-oxide reductase
MAEATNGPATRDRRRRSVLTGLLGVGLAGIGLGLVGRRAAAGEGRAIPAPMLEGMVPLGATSEVAVLAGGCFWGVQGVYQHVQGVTGAVSGYAGGEAATAHYDMVSSGSTGHAESVQVTFDPRRIGYAGILQVFFSVVHDPTQLNRQGPDVGTQYRSAIFPNGPEQARVARAYIAQLNQARVFNAAIVTRIELDRPFYPAEAYHQDYMTRYPTNPYIAFNDLPKVDDLRRLFADRFRADPVLVAASAGN